MTQPPATLDQSPETAATLLCGVLFLVLTSAAFILV